MELIRISCPNCSSLDPMPLHHLKIIDKPEIPEHQFVQCSLCKGEWGILLRPVEWCKLEVENYNMVFDFMQTTWGNKDKHYLKIMQNLISRGIDND